VTPGAIERLLGGRRQDWQARALRALLRIAEIPYGWIAAARNRRFDRRPELAQRAGCPVISVGNLTAGGTGKSPLVRWLCERLLESGHRPAIVSRGYGARGGMNDEAMEMRLILPQVAQVAAADRVGAARAAVADHQADCVVLDDGFQHRRLFRDLDIVLLDALRPFGYGHLLPRGTLREAIGGLRRAQMVGLSRADLVSDEVRAAIRQQVRQIAPEADWAEISHAPASWITLDGRQEPVAAAATAAAATTAGAPRRVAVVCGIGNPIAFVETLRRAGCEPVAIREFPDHHHYSPADAQAIMQWARSRNDVDWLVCTVKDLVKLRELIVDPAVPVRALKIDVRFLEGEPQWSQRLHEALRGDRRQL
jgi:tetraacyldisaccharide 4'-kinase